jgi:hypothetical protein
MRQSALTLVARVKDTGLEPLRRALKDNEPALREALQRVTTIHYARWVIVEPSDGYKPLLAFGSDFDGPVEAHVQDLVREFGPLLDAIYTHCEDYTPGDGASYLLNIRCPEAAFYQGSPGRTVETVRQEKRLRERLIQVLDAGDWTGKSAREVHAALRQQVLSEPEFAWAKDRLPTPGVNYLALGLLGLVLLPVLLPFIAVWAVYMQLFHERFDPPGTITPNQVPDRIIDENVVAEDYVYQNQFSQIMVMKAGRARLFTLKLFFFLTRLLIRLFFVKGKLMGIPTIHFARWVLLDGNKRLLFFSNFDGSWTQYLGDFIDKSGWGLNAIFGNTIRFPRIWFLFFRGAYDEMHFLGWSRSTQIPTQLWYVATADGEQSIRNINENTQTRNALGRDLSESAARTFLSGL